MWSSLTYVLAILCVRVPLDSQSCNSEYGTLSQRAHINRFGWIQLSVLLTLSHALNVHTCTCSPHFCLCQLETSNIFLKCSTYGPCFEPNLPRICMELSTAIKLEAKLMGMVALRRVSIVDRQLSQTDTIAIPTGTSGLIVIRGHFFIPGCSAPK